MNKGMLFVIAIIICAAFTGCKKKEPTLAERLDSSTKKIQKAAKDASQEADKAAADAQKKADDMLNK